MASVRIYFSYYLLLFEGMKIGPLLTCGLLRNRLLSSVKTVCYPFPKTRSSNSWYSWSQQATSYLQFPIRTKEVSLRPVRNYSVFLYFHQWLLRCLWWGSNSQLLGYKPSALVIELNSSKLLLGRSWVYPVGVLHHYIFIISQLSLTSHPRSTVVILDTETSGTSREIYSEDAYDKYIMMQYTNWINSTPSQQ